MVSSNPSKYGVKKFLQTIKLELHPEKSQIIPLQKGITFLGYRIFYYYKLLRKRNKKHFLKKFEKKLELYEKGELSRELLHEQLQGWFGYAKWANTFNFRKKIEEMIEKEKPTLP